MKVIRNFLGGLALAGVMASSAGAVQGEPIKIMPLGDSITAGSGMPQGGGYRVGLWRRFLEDDLDAIFVGSQVNGPPQLGSRNHEGHGGWIISQIDSNIEDWLDTYQPDIILLMIGTNDMGRAGWEEAPDRLSALMDKIIGQSPDAFLIVASIPPRSNPSLNKRTVNYNSSLPGIVEEKAAQGAYVRYVDVYNALTLEDLPDGVHPNAGGYEKVAAVWYEALTEILSVDNLFGRGHFWSTLLSTGR